MLTKRCILIETLCFAYFNFRDIFKHYNETPQGGAPSRVEIEREMIRDVESSFEERSPQVSDSI